jgi:hypothetical protein
MTRQEALALADKLELEAKTLVCGLTPNEQALVVLARAYRALTGGRKHP